MSTCIARIESESAGSFGWQARASAGGRRYLSRFFADRKYGGKRKAKALAEAALPSLGRRAARIRRAG